MQSVLFVVAHPDDVAFGMGGITWLLREKKLELVRCHASQNRDDYLAQACLRKASRRGVEADCAYAEGYRSLACHGSDGRSIFSALDQTRIIAQQR